MTDLQAYERLHQAISIEQLPPITQRELLRGFMWAFIITPFASLEFLFVPLLGQLLVGLTVLTTLIYLKARASWSMLVAVTLGIVLALALEILIAPLSHNGTRFAIFVFLALATFVMFGALIGVGGALWKLRNR